MLVEHGPDHIEGKFPKGLNNRKFSGFHHRRRLPNGEDLYRDILNIPIKSTDKVCSFCYKVFDVNIFSSLGQTAVILAQYFSLTWNAWNIKCTPSKLWKWKTLKPNLKKNSTLDNVHEKKTKEERIYRQKILTRLFTLVKTFPKVDVSGHDWKIKCS